jgi:hypothetical protein
MIAGRHLTLVTERDESLRAFEAFERAFATGADLFRDRVIGFQSGSLPVDVHWHGSAGIWGLFVRRPWDHQSGKPLDRFWCGFGLADPNQHSSLSITVEINPPHEGENPRTAGVFLRDELGRLYVGHGGRVGGGRPGIGQRAFREFAQDLTWQEIATPQGRLRDFVVFGPFQDPALLLDGLARYVHTVARFKDSYLRSVVFTPVLARVKMRAESLREVKRFPRTGIEGWLKVEVVAALGRERVRKLCNDGPDLLLNDGTDAGTRLELKAATDFNRTYILEPLTTYDVPCLFLVDGSRYKSFPTSDHDDFEVIGYEVFSDGEGQWVVGLVSPGRLQNQSRPHPGAAADVFQGGAPKTTD